METGASLVAPLRVQRLRTAQHAEAKGVPGAGVARRRTDPEQRCGPCGGESGREAPPVAATRAPDGAGKDVRVPAEHGKSRAAPARACERRAFRGRTA